jgi:hypothetical protein
MVLPVEPAEPGHWPPFGPEPSDAGGERSGVRAPTSAMPPPRHRLQPGPADRVPRRAPSASLLRTSPFVLASPAQRDKVARLACLVCGRAPVDPAHLVPRKLGGCDSPDCVIPLCRTHHRLYDDGQLRLDVHVGRGCRRERAHALTHVSAARSRRAMRGLGWERGARVRIGDLFYSDHGDARLRRGARTPSGSARRGRPGVDRRERRGVAAVRGGARREPAGSRGAAARGAP